MVADTPEGVDKLFARTYYGLELPKAGHIIGAMTTGSNHPNTRLIASSKNWIEGEAVRQLNHTAELPGVRLAVGLPDLHPGKGHPVGAAFVTEAMIYPYLVGNDIGC